jgi:L-amino acid N-acyltransferase YncA
VHGIRENKIRIKDVFSIERVPSLQGTTISLRPCRAGDLSRLQKLFRDTALPLPDEGLKTLRSFPAFSKWLLFTFQVIYLIEREKSVIGIVGLYDMKPGKSLKLSIAICNPDDRKKGYGAEALGLLFPYFQETGLAEEILAEVSSDNTRSLFFFAKAGFETLKRRDDRIVLLKKLTSSAVS